MDCLNKVVFQILLISIATMVTSAVDSGVKIRITSKGIAYVNTMAEAALKQALQSLKIPDQSGSESHISWSLDNIQIESVSGPTSQISLDPQQNGITWSLSNFGISLRADWHAKYKKGVIRISDHGSVSVGLHDVSATVTAGFGQKNGRPSIFSKGCNVHIGDVSVDFHGGTAFIWNLFKHMVAKRIQDLLQGKLCDLINQEVNVNADEELSKMKVTSLIDNRFLLDYELVASPAITSNFMEIYNKGEIYWAADKQESPFPPGTIAPWNDYSSMLYLWVTEYTAKTFAYVAHQHGYLQHNLTNKDIPSEDAGYLNTTCSSTCIGTLIPEIAKLYPNCSVELQIKSSQPPSFQITTENITAGIMANIDLVAHTPEGITHYLLTLNVSLSATVQSSIENSKLIGKITGHKFDVGVVRSDIGNIDVRSVRIMINSILILVIIPKLNKLGQKGMDLPVTGAVQLLNSQLVLLDGALLVSTDVHVTKSLMFLPEIFFSGQQRRKEKKIF